MRASYSVSRVRCLIAALNNMKLLKRKEEEEDADEEIEKLLRGDEGEGSDKYFQI